MKKYHVRFNTHHAESDQPDLVWRVFEDGREVLVKQVIIRTEVFGECTEEFGVKKWNLACLGSMTIEGDVALIT